MTAFPGSTIMPSCILPKPISSSAQIIPLEDCPRIFACLITNGSPSKGNIFVPGVATITFCPAATLGAPQTICKISPVPTSTVVRLSLSASGCLMHVFTSPITSPCNPPLTDSNDSIPSTSNPEPVSKTEVSSGEKFTGSNSFNQLYDIFICKIERQI